MSSLLFLFPTFTPLEAGIHAQERLLGLVAGEALQRIQEGYDTPVSQGWVNNQMLFYIIHHSFHIYCCLSSFSSFQFHILREPLNLTLYHDRRYLSRVKSHDDGSNTQKKKNQIKQKTLLCVHSGSYYKSFLKLYKGALPTFISCWKCFSGNFFMLKFKEES
jgi:hypothetical protein